MKPQPNRAASIIFVCLALPFGIVLGALTPPMQVPDEGHHFFRAFQIAEGGILPKKVEVSHTANELPSYTGGELPAGVLRLYYRYERLIINPKIWIQQPWANIREVAAFDIEPQRRFFQEFSNTASYSPLPYLPQALGIDLSRLFSNSVQNAFYAARFANLLVSILLIFWAIRITRLLPWTFTFLALSPMALFQTASVSSDALIISVCFLSIAWMLGCAFGPEKQISRARWWGLFLLAAALGLLRQGLYGPLVLLYLLIPVVRVGSRARYWLMLGSLGLTIVCAAAAWGLFASRTYSPVRYYANPSAQMAYITHHPGPVTEVLLPNVNQP